ncbi:Uncharacterised protein [Shewanella baltica]|nr:Uncharacterised protein [Shewanella baltica]
MPTLGIEGGNIVFVVISLAILLTIEVSQGVN